MPASDFVEGMLLESQIEPFGDRRLDILTALITSMIANVNRPSKSSPYPLKDFIPKWDKAEVRPQTVEEQEQILVFLQQAQQKRLEN